MVLPESTVTGGDHTGEPPQDSCEELTIDTDGPRPPMTDRRGLAAGICFVVGSLPLIGFYGFHPYGYAGMAVCLFGIVVSYGAYESEAV